MNTTDQTFEIGRVAYYNTKTRKFSIARVYHVTTDNLTYYSVRFVKPSGEIEHLGENADLEKAINTYCLRSNFGLLDIIPFYPRDVLNYVGIDAYAFTSEVENG